ncbi:MAG TPA: 6-pyruvoyl-tetrahydropterin synthase-related protein [Candidatus Saccharimonadales bacterium]|nr:6-pyruvoyl-tetrahydropterin synthase-related protein [Candidatus Saccharimonadales bacterium]
MNKQKIPLFVYAALTLAVMLPLLRSGFILTVDLVFTPTIPWPTSLTPSYPFWALLHILNIIVPSQIIEKALLCGILLAAGYGAYKMVEMFRVTGSENGRRAAAYFAGVLYMFNPYVYSRFMAGQFAVLMGYALLPLFVLVLWRFLEKPGTRRALLMMLAATGIVILSVHAAGFITLLSVIFAVLFAWRRRNDKEWLRAFLQCTGLAVVALLVVNSWWILPALFGHGATAQVVHGFTNNDFSAFATNGRGFGVVGNVLGLQGFWADSKNLFLVPQDVFVWWRVPIIGLWVIVAGGVIVGLRRWRGVSAAFLLVAAIVAVLAIGTAGTIVAPFNRWLLHAVPFFAGYREPQKFVALIALAYAYFGAVAIAAIYDWLYNVKSLKQHAATAAFLLCVVPILCAPLMMWGFHAQLHAAEYPVEWNAIHDRLDAECTGDCKVLFLPWHMYMPYGFAGRVIASPAPKFFGPRVIASSDPEFRGIAPANITAEQRAVDDTILPAAAHGGTQMGAALKRYNVQYVLLAKEYDYKTYDYLAAQRDLKVVLDTPSLTLYQVTVSK